MPAVLKVKTGAHEVVTTIMMNGIAVSLLAWALLGPLVTAQTGFLDSDRPLPGDRADPPLAPAFGLEEQILPPCT